MEETPQHLQTKQYFGLPPSKSGNHYPDGPKTNHILTLNVGHLTGANYTQVAHEVRTREQTYYWWRSYYTHLLIRGRTCPVP